MSETKPTANGAIIPCERCPLAGNGPFRAFTKPELNFVSGFKTGELRVEPGATVLVQGAHSAHLYTILSGWMFRFKDLEDGRRQILNYALPGNLIGLQGSILGEMEHGVEALTPVTLCVFEKERLHDLYKRFPSLAYDITWLAAREESILDEHLTSVGRRSALERAAYLLAFLFRRARSVRLLNGHTKEIPITQQHVADTLGLSIVHTNKTLRKLADRKLIAWQARGCTILDGEGLADIAGWVPNEGTERPFI